MKIGVEFYPPRSYKLTALLLASVHFPEVHASFTIRFLCTYGAPPETLR